MGHAEVAEAPGEGGGDSEEVVRHDLLGDDVGGGAEADVAFEAGGGLHGIPAAGHFNAEEHDDHEGDGHDDGLHEVSHGGGEEAAEDGVAGDDGAADDHAVHVVHAAERGEELAAGGEAGRSVGDEEDDDDKGGNGHEQVALVVEAMGEEVRNGDGVDLFAIHAQALGHDEPVQVGANGEADDCPGGFGDAAEQGKAGDAHEQPGGHVGGFSAHGGDDGAHLAVAKVVFAGVVVGLGAGNADIHHEEEVRGNSNVNEDLIFAHDSSRMRMWKDGGTPEMPGSERAGQGRS